MVNAVEFLIGLAIGTGLVSIYYFVMLRRGGAQVERYRRRLRQAMTIFGVSAVFAIGGEILLRMN